MKLYAFTEQGLKDLLEQYAINVLKDIKEADKDNRPVSKHDLLYPAFPEPVELPELNDIEVAAHKHSIFNKEKWAYISGANHIITLIKNGLK